MRTPPHILWTLAILMAFASRKAMGNAYQYYILGDSMIKTGLGNTLKKKLQSQSKIPVRIFGKSSSGLSRPDTFDWQQTLNTELKSAATKDQVQAFVMLGTNDCQDIPSPGGSKKYGTDEWKAAYQERLKEFAQTLCNRVSRVYWLGLPPMRSKSFNTKIQNLNLLISETLKTESCVTFLATDQILGTAAGEYTRTLQYRQKTLAIREPDGIHMTYEGAKILSENLFKTHSTLTPRPDD